MNQKTERVSKLIFECEQHKSRIEYASGQMHAYMPLSIESFRKLSNAEIQQIDQYTFRFSKLQDTMGEGLFSAVLSALEESYKNRPFIDILNRLEQLELLQDKNTWLELRKIRNELAHDYESDLASLVESINSVFAHKETLLKAYQKISDFCQSKGWS